MKVTVIDDALLTELSAEAQASPRLRKNRNLHRDYQEPCQRLLNAMEPGSYIRPHRHLDPPKPEAFLVLRGRFAALIFDDDGTLMQVVPLGRGAASGLDVPAGVWHSIVCLEEGSVFFETKPGPYAPLDDKDFAPWAPAEGSPEAVAYLARLAARTAPMEGS